VYLTLAPEKREWLAALFHSFISVNRVASRQGVGCVPVPVGCPSTGWLCPSTGWLSQYRLAVSQYRLAVSQYRFRRSGGRHTPGNSLEFTPGTPGRVSRDSSVGITSHYGLDGPGIKSWWGRDFPYPSRPALMPTQPPTQWEPGLSRG